ncbi:MAG: arsenate reductase [Myxococcota bacterium]
MKLLKAEGVEYHYREYTKEPLTEAEIRQVLAQLDVPIKTVFRKNDKANKELGLTGDEPTDELIAKMAAHPTLLQRPIGVLNGQAIVGRPVERLLELTR